MSKNQGIVKGSKQIKGSGQKIERIKGSNEEKSEKRNRMIKMKIGTKDKTPEPTKNNAKRTRKR